MRKEQLSTRVKTECVVSGRSIVMAIDSDLNIDILEGGPAPMVFVPPLDLPNWRDPSIIDNF
ncbi:MAG: hypothetical protein OEV49_06480 [candidate division Zixibacteria bacterium]|nr:hypothetical protein [candidate division Zixibacteria bacterium]MDH3935868.1 hypothetical protein [candidate division Zixibacteria bacterium]MDH4032898.1 hypothetical protein [candidate division Zixibacteria bacterium]